MRTYKYSHHLNNEQVWYTNGGPQFGCQMMLKVFKIINHFLATLYLTDVEIIKICIHSIWFQRLHPPTTSPPHHHTMHVPTHAWPSLPIRKYPILTPPNLYGKGLHYTAAVCLFSIQINLIFGHSVFRSHCGSRPHSCPPTV